MATNEVLPAGCLTKMMIQDMLFDFGISNYIYYIWDPLGGGRGLKIETDRGSWGPRVLGYNYCMLTLFHWFS